MMRRGMQQDFSWKASAEAYAALYRRLLGPVSQPARAENRAA